MNVLKRHITLEELHRVTSNVQERRGWDFSPLQMESDAVPWDYGEVVQRFMHPSSRVLDVGTGGGEVFISLAALFGEGLGIDASEEMIRVAKENLPPDLMHKVSFKPMRAEALDEPQESFNVVLNRHCPVVAEQVVRVLRHDGYFVTQQVGADNDATIFEAFDWGSNGQFWADWHEQHGGLAPTTLDQLSEEFDQLGCRVVAKGEYNVRCWFKDVASLVFQLKAAPFPEEFEPDRHWQCVNRLLTRASVRGIESNENRWLLVVRKP